MQGDEQRYCKCGKDISHRHPSVHICVECKVEDDKVKAAQRNMYNKQLKERDTYAPPVNRAVVGGFIAKQYCPVCDSILVPTQNYCHNCGKRVKMDPSDAELLLCPHNCGFIRKDFVSDIMKSKPVCEASCVRFSDSLKRADKEVFFRDEQCLRHFSSLCSIPKKKGVLI